MRNESGATTQFPQMGQSPPARTARPLGKRSAKRTAHPALFSKPCTVYESPSDVLIRCTIDTTKHRLMVCGKCWKTGDLRKNRYAETT